MKSPQASRVHEIELLKNLPKAVKHLRSVTTDKLYDLAVKAHDVLFRANTTMVFDLVPDTVIVDREKLTIIRRHLMGRASTSMIPLRNILDIDVETGTFFGCLWVTSHHYLNKPDKIDFLRRADALKAHRLIQGYIVAQHRDINCSHIPKDDLILLLEDLGSATADHLG